MPTQNDSQSIADEFELLTEKQAAVLRLLARSLTSKEIAGQLGTSESAVNRHIEILRSRFGGITRAQLARRYRERPADFDQSARPAACVDAAKQIIDLAETPHGGEGEPQGGPEGGFVFRDSFEMTIEAPWTRPEDQRIVPRVLDGEHAALTRGAAIAIILFAIIASLVLGLAAAQAITDALGD